MGRTERVDLNLQTNEITILIKILLGERLYCKIIIAIDI